MINQTIVIVVALALIAISFAVIAYLDRCPNCGKWAGMKVKKIVEMPASPFNSAPYTVCHKQCSKCGHRRTIL